MGNPTPKEEVPMDDRKYSLDERLKSYPELRNRFYRILSIVEDSEEEIDKADEAEERVIEELRRLGQEVLQDWAVSKERQKVEKVKRTSNPKVSRHGKKNFTGTRRSEK
jgi:hypothetical protein